VPTGADVVEREVGAVGRILLAFSRVADAISEALGWLAKWLVPSCVVVGFVNVLLRYIGRIQNRSLTSNRYVELQWMLFGAIFLLVLPYVLKHAINVRVDFLYAKFSRRRQALIDFCGHLIGLVPYCLLALWVNWDYALTSLFQKGRTVGDVAGVGGVGAVTGRPRVAAGTDQGARARRVLLPAGPDPGRTREARFRADREGGRGRTRGAARDSVESGMTSSRPGVGSPAPEHRGRRSDG